MAADKTGFFEESPGVRSMTRLCIFWMCVLASLIVVSMCAYLLFKTPDAAILAGMTSALLAVAVKGMTALKNRNGADDSN